MPDSWGKKMICKQETWIQTVKHGKTARTLRVPWFLESPSNWWTSKRKILPRYWLLALYFLTTKNISKSTENWNKVNTRGSYLQTQKTSAPSPKSWVSLNPSRVSRLFPKSLTKTAIGDRDWGVTFTSTNPFRNLQSFQSTRDLGFAQRRHFFSALDLTFFGP